MRSISYHLERYNMSSIALAATLTPHGTVLPFLSNSLSFTTSVAYLLISFNSLPNCCCKGLASVVTRRLASRSRWAERLP